MRVADSNQFSGARRLLGGLLLVALALRLGWGLSRPSDRAAIERLPDQRDYLSIARNLLDGKGMQFLDRRFVDTVRAFRTPGYPLWVAACGARPSIVRAGQAVLDTSAVLAVFLLAMNLSGGRRRPAFLAAGLVAFNPFLIYFTGLILSETLFTAMLAWGMWLLVWGRGGNGPGRRRTAAWLVGGVLLATSVLVRPSAVALPVVLAIASAFAARSEVGGVNRGSNRSGRDAYHQRPAVRGRWPLPIGVTFLAITALVLLPWALRNQKVLGRWVWLDTNGGFTLYDGYNPDATGASDQSFVARLPELQVLDEVSRSEYLEAAAIRNARSDYARDVRLALARLGRTWSAVPLSDAFGTPAYRLVGAAWAIPFDVLVLLGVWKGGLPRSVKWFLLAPAVYLTVVHALTVGSLRYRIPAEPMLAIVAASIVAGAEPVRWRRDDVAG